KVLPAHLAEDPAALVRFEREARAIAALSAHHSRSQKPHRRWQLLLGNDSAFKPSGMSAAMQRCLTCYNNLRDIMPLASWESRRSQEHACSPLMS
ncbi:MAG: hypothetical protein ABSH28_19970, partial [Acidobacteriota bacterium]